jgi:hypothetical protein
MPAWFYTVKAKWKRFGDFMSEKVTLVIFTLLFVVVFAPVAIVLKLMKRRFLPQFTGNEETYYLPKQHIKPTVESLKRQG